MNAWIKWVGVGAMVCVVGAVGAQEPPAVQAQLDAARSVEALGELLKARLAQGLPGELVFEKKTNWGHQAQVPSIQGITPITVLRNHGNWQKARVIVKDVPQRLRVNVGWVCSTADGRMSFNVHVALPAHLELQQQIWQNGVQVYTDHICSRLQLSAHLQMEAEIEPGTGATRLRLVGGTYACDHFVAEHVGGFGGEAARWLDSGAGRSFKPWQPAVLNDFQAQISTIIGAANDVVAVRNCVSKLLVYADGARTVTVQSQYPDLTPSSALAGPRPVPLFVNSAVDFQISGSFRISETHFERIMHPGLAEAAIHVAHAAAVVAGHVHGGGEHKK